MSKIECTNGKYVFSQCHVFVENRETVIKEKKKKRKIKKQLNKNQ